MVGGVFGNIRDEHIRKERFFSVKNLSHLAFGKSVFFCNHTKRLSDMKSFRQSRICDNTGSTACNIVMLALSANILETVWITYRERVTPLSSTSAKHLLPVNRRSSSKESVHSKSLSFLEFTNHKEAILKIVGGLYEKRQFCQTVFRDK